MHSKHHFILYKYENVVLLTTIYLFKQMLLKLIQKIIILTEKRIYKRYYVVTLIYKYIIIEGIHLPYRIKVASSLVKIQSFDGETGVTSPWCRSGWLFKEAVCCPDYMPLTLSHTSKIQKNMENIYNNYWNIDMEIFSTSYYYFKYENEKMNTK